MSRPKKKEEERKVRINISLSKSVYKNLKKKGVNISGTIERLLKVAYFNDRNFENNLAATRVQIPAGALFLINYFEPFFSISAKSFSSAVK